MTEEESVQYCSICQMRFHEEEGIGHHAQPVNDGRCCTICNESVVIPARRNLARRNAQ
jgi:hypothetical protein